MNALLAKIWTQRWRVLAGLGALALAGYLALNAVFGPRVDVAKVARRDVVQSVVASGRVVTPYRVDVGSQITGTVAEVPVEQGERVKAGQTLVVLEASEARALVKQAEVNVAQSEARLRQMRELQLPVADQTLRQAEANLTNARAQYERNRQLYQSGYIGKSVLDDSQRNVEVAESQVDSARKQVETARPTGSDYAVAVAALEQARANLQAAQARLAYATVRAPADGTLIARDVERGDVVQPGKVLFVLSPVGETQLVLQIDERNLARLKLGQQALASADAYPAERFGAELFYINPSVDPQRGTVEVKLRVPTPPAYLREDMTVSVDIEVDRHADALALPANAVHDVAGADPWVLHVKDGRAIRRPVKVGLRGEGSVEIRGGLEAGDLVVPADNTSVKPGRRVRAVPHD
ncbi:MAG TPA: efflux RND transporter periplasmic adaptor subunit [Burkholderiales bacterium]|nr:efflux RND transporter periplasmic adaptor subunit [Burkholderiales bacterium]